MNNYHENKKNDSKDNLWNDIQVYVNGMTSLIVENYKSIIYCSQNEFVIKGYRQKIHIFGLHMSILNFDEYEIQISGCIQTIKIMGLE